MFLKVKAVLFTSVCLFAATLFAQETTPAAENPLAVLKSEVEKVLADAGVPFTPEQDDAITLMMEDRRQASEELFGDLMNFSAGPTQGQDADRLRSAIEWMRKEFLSRLENYLTAEQRSVWAGYLKERDTAAAEVQLERPTEPQGRPEQRQDQQQQTQYVRLNSNDFSADEPAYRMGNRRTEVFQRGGIGAFHGNFQFLLRDESLNASRRSYNRGRRVPTVKPPYQERQLNFSVSGPLIPNRLTWSFIGSQNEAENVETINATLAGGVPFSSEVARPTTDRSFATTGTYQLAESHSLNFSLSYAPYSRRNQGIGGFVLPERAWTTRGNTWEFEVKPFSALSPQSTYETRFKIRRGHVETIPATNAPQIEVVDAFGGGGSQNRSMVEERTYEFGTLYTRVSGNLSLRAGATGIYRKNRNLSHENFDGTFTFSSLGDLDAARPFQFRIARGEPLLETGQLEMGFFVQEDWKVTPTLTLYPGLRYDFQTNLTDRDNFGPRLAFAYAVGQATVIRGGAGVFFNRVGIDLIEAQRRFDGQRQYETVIDRPSFPDPFLAGTARTVFSSVRVTDPHLSVPYITATRISVERTFLTTLFLSASYEHTHEARRLRYRNINAPYDSTTPVDPIPRSCTRDQAPGTCIRPDPTQGDIISLESTRAGLHHLFRLTYRQRFRIFTASANYLLQRMRSSGGPNPATAGSTSSDSYNLRADWSLDRTFPRHNLSTTVNAQLPLGLFLAGTMTTNTGQRYNITTGRDDNQDGNLSDRPPGVGRNTGPARGVMTFDFNISKAFFFEAPGGNGGTRKNANVFANITNAFNRANMNPASGVMTSPNFGLATSAMDPRLIEIGMRFQF
jgi:hypothetical protein